jgi:hypothetical protein
MMHDAPPPARALQDTQVVRANGNLPRTVSRLFSSARVNWAAATMLLPRVPEIPTVGVIIVHSVFRLASVSLIAMALLVPTETAAAAPPSNDTIEGAIAVSVGTRTQLDTTKATSDAVDAELGPRIEDQCIRYDPDDQTGHVPYATYSSVWYSFVSRRNADIMLDVSGSNYASGAQLVVLSGQPGAFAIVACPNTDQVGFEARAGEKYYFLAYDRDAARGGTFSLAVARIPRPQLSFKVRRITMNADFTVASGSYRCVGAIYMLLAGEARETKPSQATGGIFLEMDVPGGLKCNGTRQRWQGAIAPESGTFVQGRGVTIVRGLACTIVRCVNVPFTQRKVKFKAAASAHELGFRLPMASS